MAMYRSKEVGLVVQVIHQVPDGLVVLSRKRLGMGEDPGSDGLTSLGPTPALARALPLWVGSAGAQQHRQARDDDPSAKRKSRACGEVQPELRKEYDSQIEAQLRRAEVRLEVHGR